MTDGATSRQARIGKRIVVVRRPRHFVRGLCRNLRVGPRLPAGPEQGAHTAARTRTGQGHAGGMHLIMPFRRRWRRQRNEMGY